MTTSQRDGMLQTTSPHFTLFERPLASTTNGRIASKCELYARVQTSTLAFTGPGSMAIYEIVTY